jgi:hypothetical protein
MYPDRAKETSKGYSDGGSIMWNAFTKVSGLDRLFRFTPAFSKWSAVVTNDTDSDKRSTDQDLDK